jgi:hypothetical protein
MGGSCKSSLEIHQHTYNAFALQFIEFICERMKCLGDHKDMLVEYGSESGVARIVAEMYTKTMGQ